MDRTRQRLADLQANLNAARPATMTDEEKPTVFVVDDDEWVRNGLCNLLSSMGLRALPFKSARDLLGCDLPNAPSCLVLDIRLPELSGLELQAKLTQAKIGIPVIFMTGHGDIPMSVKAMKAGAIDFLTKPFRDQDMLDAVMLALEQDRVRRCQETANAELQARFDMLTARERQVMAYVARGVMNKNTAFELGVSEITVKVHRSNMMKKLGARSQADVVRMADALKLCREELERR